MNADPVTVTSQQTPLLDIDGASVRREGKIILDDLNLTVTPGQHSVILGANGAGKSTLVKLVSRQIYPLFRKDGRGTIRVFGRDRWNVAELRGMLGIVSPSLQRQYTAEYDLEVFEAVVSSFFSTSGFGLDQEVTDVMHQQAIAALDRMDATHLVQRKMSSLSTGEARRVLIARALVHHPRALLLDEPCAGLDLASRMHFLENLRVLARTGTTLLLVTHHIEEILPEVNQVVVLRNGKTFKQGSKDETLTDDVLSEAFGATIRVARDGDWYHAHIVHEEATEETAG